MTLSHGDLKLEILKTVITTLSHLDLKLEVENEQILKCFSEETIFLTLLSHNKNNSSNITYKHI